MICTILRPGKLTWIIHTVGAVIGGRVSFAATDDHDTMDGELVIRVLQLMNVTDQYVRIVVASNSEPAFQNKALHICITGSVKPRLASRMRLFGCPYAAH